MDYTKALKFFNESELAKNIKKAEHMGEIIYDGNGIYFLRCDGRHFKSFTKGLKKPFDKILRTTMERTMIALCEEIQGSVIGFTQSDEITVMFKKQNEESQLPYSGRKAKIETSAAASCTLFFNKIFMEEVSNAKLETIEEYSKNSSLTQSEIIDKVNKEFEVYEKKFLTATFDARCFETSTPIEAQSVLIWRILDCYKNAIQMIARCNFSNKELHQKKTYEMVQMLENKGVKISSFPIRNIYGAFCCKEEKILYVGTDRECVRKKYTLKNALESIFELPYFKNDTYSIGEIVKVEKQGETIFGKITKILKEDYLIQIQLLDGSLRNIHKEDII